MSGPHAPTRRRIVVALVVAAALAVFGPPLAGMAFLVLQVLHDTSYDLSRFGVEDVPRAALALAVSGSAYGYLYGLVPAVAAAAGAAGLVLAGRRLTLLRLVLCVGAGGTLGALLAAPVVGAAPGLALVILMLGLSAAAWMVMGRHVPAEASR